MNYVLQRIKSYCKASYYLITHPNNTIQYLTTLRESDVILFLFIAVIELLPALLYDIINAITGPSLPSGILENASTFYNYYKYPFFIALSYLLWRMYSYTLWSMLEYMGANIRRETMRIGLLHIYLFNIIFGTAVLILLALLSPALFTIKLNFYLILMVNFSIGFGIFVWTAWLLLRFLRILTNISYVKVIVAIFLQGLIIGVFQFGLQAMGLFDLLIL